MALLDNGADANTTDKPQTPITLKSVLDDFWNRLKGNKPPKDTTFYRTALWLSYSGNYWGERMSPENPELIQSLLEHGADPDARNKGGWTVLFYASMYRHHRTVKALLEHKAHPDIGGNADGWTPLMVADLEDARLLVEHGAKVSCPDISGGTALDCARLKGDQSLIRYLEQALKEEQNPSGKRP